MSVGHVPSAWFTSKPDQGRLVAFAESELIQVNLWEVRWKILAAGIA